MIIKQSLLLLGFLVVGFPGIITNGQPMSREMEASSRQMPNNPIMIGMPINPVITPVIPTNPVVTPGMPANPVVTPGMPTNPVVTPGMTMVPVMTGNGNMMMMMMMPAMMTPAPTTTAPATSAVANAVASAVSAGSGKKGRGEGKDGGKKKKMEIQPGSKNPMNMQMGIAPLMINSIRLMQTIIQGFATMGIKIGVEYTRELMTLIVRNAFSPFSQVFTRDGIPQFYQSASNIAGTVWQVVMQVG